MDVHISETTSTNQDPGTLPRGRQHASGAGGADGSIGGDARRRSIAARPRFDAPVENNGYRWWYIDAASDDGKHGLTIIGFVGSVFSPYYVRARKRGTANPENHCAINVALYGRKRRWAMTERGSRHITRSAEQFRVGPSSMTWAENVLTIDIDERCCPLPLSLRGRISLIADPCCDAPVSLDGNGKHYWQAVAPNGKIEVSFQNPQLTWSGTAYHDMNWGSEPLEKAFKQWTWLRAKTDTGTEVLYDIERHDGTRFSFGRMFKAGQAQACGVPAQHDLPRGFWGMSRSVNSEAQPTLISKLEDAPFYTRNHIGLTLNGARQDAFHESLSLQRFVHPVVQLMLPFRMPRIP
jgi:carotenoid 1,2-hydratase